MEFDELIKLQKNMRNQVTEGKIKRNYIQMEKVIHNFPVLLHLSLLLNKFGVFLKSFLLDL
jgi:hypothetical protein